MIDKTELRSGNFVNVPHGDVQIDYLIKEGVHLVDGCGGTWQSLESIPITPEWLERLGMTYDGQVSDKQYWYNRYNKCLCEDYSEGDGGTHIIAECLYVHSLQNLYFALTGEELELKQ